jgi:EAL domain-containing protein (putative c-di-GMP-specific phosphodiesterase class I)
VALKRVHDRRYDAIVSDIRMPNADGIAVLKEVRQHDPQVPFILMTGAPTVETAISGMQFGALRYLPKPFNIDELVQVVTEAVAHRVRDINLPDQHTKLDAALSAMHMAYQPIVSWSARKPLAWEALLRCTDRAVNGPMEMLELAESTGRVHELGRLVRRHTALELERHSDAQLFVNLHPEDLQDDHLYDPKAPLSLLAGRVVLEITERASVAALDQLPEYIRRLRTLGFRIAIDDLGAGYAGLTTFARVEPEFVKLDGSLIRGIDGSATRQRIVQSVSEMATGLGIQVVAECIETAAERRAVTRLGIDLLQGYLFARPGKPMVEPSAEALAEAAA